MSIRRWDLQASPEDRDQMIVELSVWHLSQCLDCQKTRDISRLLFSWDIKGLVGYEMVYSGDDDVTTLRHLRQILAFFQKRQDLDLGINREEVAYVKFMESEELCKQTNDLFRAWRSRRFQFCRDVDLVFYKASRKIAQILGEVPSLADLRPRFGPGATTQIKKKEASARRKLGEPFCCSEDLLPIAATLLEEMPSWVQFEEDLESALVPVVLHHGKLSFVPKNAKTDRAICVEPSLNSMWQLGIGDYIAKRLKRFGVDLTDQSRNQNLAREGSITGALATLDLSSASDTVARELVFHLLPLDWAFFLDYLRTGVVSIDDQTLQLQKFSSMGNGFTFALESLIFYALTASCCEGRGELEKVSVYGDDIIIPSHRAPLLVKVLRSAGFIPNEEKSFISGPFRESCGKDYLLGFDIRPSYLKDGLSGEDAFVLHNHYVRTWQPEAAQIVSSYIHPDLAIYGPDGYGDGHLLGDWIPRPCKREWGWCGYIFDTYTWRGRKSFKVTPGDSVLPFYSIYTREAQPRPPVSLAYKARDRYVDPVDAEWLEFPYQPSNSDMAVDEWQKYSFSPPEFRYDSRKGTLGVTLPGVKGYKRISIYTLKK